MNSLQTPVVSPMRGWPFRMAICGLLAWTFALVLIPDAWAVQATPVSLSFTAVQGGPNPTSQVVTISKSTSRQVGWKAADNAAWLSAAPSSGTMTTSGQIAVTVNASGLAAGTYSGSLKVTLSKGGSLSIPVTLMVASAPPTKSVTTTTTATLSWMPNTDSDLAGYKVYMGTSSGLYGTPVDVGNVTTYTAGNLTVGTTYYFTVTAYDQSKNESLHSSEVNKSIY
ncbi:MAG: Fibronectin type-III domain-containing protein [Nitrospira sp.]|nr:MAG: Fibronectin type-III domain-containing protein [Nitrospira sp.]